MGARNELHATVQRLRLQLEPWFSADTAAPGTQWHGAPRSIGHCAAVALIFQASIGGDLQSTYVEGVSHWFNRLREEERWVDVDLTGDQFGRAPVQIEPAGRLYPGAHLRTAHEVAAETTRRALTLATRADLDDVCRVLAKLV